MSKLTPEERRGLAGILGISACGLIAAVLDEATTCDEIGEYMAVLGLLGWSFAELLDMHNLGHEIAGFRCGA